MTFSVEDNLQNSFSLEALPLTCINTSNQNETAFWSMYNCTTKKKIFINYKTLVLFEMNKDFLLLFSRDFFNHQCFFNYTKTKFEVFVPVFLCYASELLFYVIKYFFEILKVRSFEIKIIFENVIC